MRNVGVGVLVMALTGCASITGSKLQPISVQAVHENKDVTGVGCTLTNDAGKWFVTTPGTVTIQKSTADLAVDCGKDNAIVGQEHVVSKANGGVLGNILAGGLIWYAIDRNSGAGFDYPQSITVVMRKVGEALGIVPPAPATPQPSGAQAQPQTSTVTATAEIKPN